MAAFSPLGALRHHLRHGVKRVTGFSVAQGLPTNPVPLPPRCIGRAAKGKRLYGQAGRLTSPDLHILCRMCTVGLWVLPNKPHDAAGHRRAKFPPRGKGGAKHQKGCISRARKGGFMVFINWRRSRPPEPSRPKGRVPKPLYHSPLLHYTYL